MNPSAPLAPAAIRIVLIEDHAVVRVGLKTILLDEPGIQVVGEAATGREGLEQVAVARPDVVLLDLRLPDLEGFEVCRRIKATHPAPAVLVLTSFADDALVLSTISAGADGYLLKDFEQVDLAEAIRKVAAGGSVLDPLIARKILNSTRGNPTPPAGTGRETPFERLSRQEQRVLELIAAGRTNREVASSLSLGEGTVRNYLTSIFNKLGVDNRTEAAALWVRHSVRRET